MSTVLEKPKSPFAEAEAQRLPTLFCIGYVSQVGDAKVSESGKYILQNLVVSPLGPGRMAFVRIMYRPEWLKPGFDPKSFKTLKDGSGMEFVYRSNIAGHDSVSNLKGLSGSDERFADLGARLQNLSDVNPDTVKKVLTDFFTVEEGEAPFAIGYDLRQGKDDTGEVNDKGKKIKVLNNRYEVGSWWFVTDKTKAAKRKQANKSPENYKVAFEDADGEASPF